MANNLDELVITIRADDSGLQASMRTASGAVKTFANTTKTELSSLDSSLASLKTSVLAFASVWGAIEVGKSIVDAGIQLQGLQFRMQAATGDSKVAADALAFVRQECDRLGLSFIDNANSFASFSASALRSGMTFSQTKDVFNGLAEAVTALHLPTSQANSAFLALEQMASKGTVQMQELKLQLAQAIPGAFEIMAKATGHSVQEFNQLISKGDILASDALPKLAAAFHEQFGDAAMQAADGAQAAFNRLGNALFDLKTEFAQGGFLDAVTNGVVDLTKALNDPDVKGGLLAFASGLGKIAELAITATAKLANLAEEAGKWAGSGLADRLVMAPADLPDALKQKIAQRGYDAPGLVSGAVAGVGTPPKNTNGSYTLGTATTGVSAASQKAANARQQLANRVNQMSSGFIAEANPDKVQGAKAIAGLNKQYQSEQDLLDKALQKKAITTQKYNELSLKAEIDYDSKMAALHKQYRNNFISDQQAAVEGFLGVQLGYQQKSISEQGASFAQSLQLGAQHNKTMFELAKVAAIASASVKAAESVVDAYWFGTFLGGPMLGAAFAGVAAAAQAANIAAIANQSFGGGSSVSSSGGGSVPSVGGNDSSSAAPTQNGNVTNMYVSVQSDKGGLWSDAGVRDLIDRINDAGKDGKVIVHYA